MERRYAKIDAGEAVYMCGLFGMPIEVETPLLKARKEKVERGDEVDVIETEKVSSDSVKEASGESACEFKAGSKYKEQYSGAVATIKHRVYNVVSLELKHKGQELPIQLRAELVDGVEEIKASLSYVDKRGCWKQMKISLKATDIIKTGGSM